MHIYISQTIIPQWIYEKPNSPTFGTWNSQEARGLDCLQCSFALFGSAVLTKNIKKQTLPFLIFRHSKLGIFLSLKTSSTFHCSILHRNTFNDSIIAEAIFHRSCKVRAQRVAPKLKALSNLLENPGTGRRQDWYKDATSTLSTQTKQSSQSWQLDIYFTSLWIIYIYIYICVCKYMCMYILCFTNFLAPSPNGNAAHIVALVYIYIYIYIPGTQMTLALEVELGSIQRFAVKKHKAAK